MDIDGELELLHIYILPKLVFSETDEWTIDEVWQILRRMIGYKEILGAMATIIGFIGYIPYFRGIFLGSTKPHAFSWFIWGLIMAIVFAVQVVEKGGPGTWNTALSTIACFSIAILALFYGKRAFPFFDWIILVTAMLSLVFWRLMNDPTVSIVIISIVDAVGFVPTFRKGFNLPFEENISTYASFALKFTISIIALDTLTIATWLYPASLVLMNGAFAFLLLARRRQLSSATIVPA